MFDLSKFSTVAQVEAAIVMAEKARSENLYKKTVLERQVANAQESPSSTTLTPGQIDQLIAALNRSIASATTPEALVNINQSIGAYQERKQRLLAREASQSPNAVQTKIALAEFQRVKVESIDVYIAELNTLKNQLLAA
jgi:hypothetical protein